MIQDDFGLNGMLVGLIKPHIPKIANKIIPYLNDRLADMLYCASQNAQPDEKQTSIMLFCDKHENIYMSICYLSEDDRIIRQQTPVQLKEYINTLIQEALKTE